MTLRRMVRRKHLRNYLPFSETQIDTLLKERKLPFSAVKLVEGGNASAFFEDEIIAYQEKLAAERDRPDTSPETGATRPKSALLNRPRKAVR